MKIRLRYKGMDVNSFGLPISKPDKNKTKVNPPGRMYYQLKYFIHNYKNTAPKDLIVMYDIPKDKKKERDWFRRHLQKFDYVMVQKSVWVGPSPLPKDFLNYVKSIGLLSRLRTLKLAKPYLKRENDL